MKYLGRGRWGLPHTPQTPVRLKKITSQAEVPSQKKPKRKKKAVRKGRTGKPTTAATPQRPKKRLPPMKKRPWWRLW